MATQRDKRSSHFQGQTLRRLKQSEENIISLKKDIQMLKTQVRKRPSTEQKLQEEIIILKNQNQDDLLNKIQNTKTYIAQLKQYTQNLKTDFSENRQAVIEAFQKLKEQLIIELSKIKVDNENEFAYMNNFSHPFSPHKFHYRAIKSGTDIIATRTNVDNTSYRNFIHTLQIGNGDAVNFTVKINRLTSNALLLGVGTQQVFNKLDPFSEDSCFYSANVGGIWNGSAFIDGKSKSEAGDQLQLLIDRKKNQLFWKRNGQSLEQIKLPNIFENKPSFLIIKLAHYEDSITVSAKKL